MIALYVVPNKPPLDGYSANTDRQHQLLGLWLDGDVRGGGDDYDIERLWRDIGRHLIGDLPKLQHTSDIFTLKVEQHVATLFAGVMPHAKPLALSLEDFSDATERWFDVVDPRTAESLRAIRATWRA